MRKLALFIILIHYSHMLAGQTNVMDTTLFFNWLSIPDWYSHAVSNNGQYVLYPVQNMPMYSNTTIVQALNRDWQASLTDVTEAVFTNDSKQVIYRGANDSLCLLSLLNQHKTYISAVRSFKLFMQEGTEWLICETTHADKSILLYNLATGSELKYKNIDSYLLNEDGNVLILKTTTTEANKHNTLEWIDLLKKTTRKIYEGLNINDLCLDKTGKKLAFTSTENDLADKNIWLYEEGTKKAIVLTNVASQSMPSGMLLSTINNFSANSGELFIQLKKKKNIQKPSGVAPLIIWSYTDVKLQSQQLYESTYGDSSYLAVIHLQKPFTIQTLQHENETISDIKNDLVLCISKKGDEYEQYWNKAVSSLPYLISTKDGSRIGVHLQDASFSPNGKYLIGYSPDEPWGGDLYVYNIASGTTQNITAVLPIPLQNEENNLPVHNKGRGLMIAGWLPQDKALLIYDNYDIWQVDLTTAIAPINLTKGRNSKVRFRLAEIDYMHSKVMDLSRPLILSAFNKLTKQSGFFKLSLNDTIAPEQLSMGDYIYKPGYLKAQQANIYLVTREQTDHSPNIFSTTDFKTFTAISRIQPEKTVNWFTSELINFTTSDSALTQAVLYKPTDLDPLKKYPLIIHYYDKKSDQLNHYQHPLPESGSDLDIAWFACHGYLVLLTDINFKTGQPGESVARAVTGAVKYLSQRPYVDMTHIGLQGHSFGGYETNYMVTHSSLFAAVVASAGVVNITSDYSNLWQGGRSRQEYWETSDGRLGTTPWEAPDIYIQNSPIFFVGKVNTPLLIVHGKKDKNVYFEQSLEFFTALRRAGKRAWLLQYDNAGHGLSGEDNKDYLFRMSQFFDHYLKGAPAPRWMTRGIPAAMKGLDDGFQLDNEIKTPGEGLLKK